MKKLLIVWCAVAASLFAGGCRDSELTDRVDDLENRVASLEELCRQANANIASLQMLVAALQEQDIVKSVTPVVQDGATVGWEIVFAKSGTVTLHDGAPGEAGEAPVVGVREADDGRYYWVVNGEWLTDGSGGKIPAEGEPGEPGSAGITPQLKIENARWLISYDEGAAWTEVGPAAGDALFAEVDTSDPDEVRFILADGTEIRFPFGMISPTGIVVLTDRVALGIGTPGRFEFRINPSNARVDLRFEGDAPTLQLDKVGPGTRAADSYVTVPERYRLVSVEPSTNEAGETLAGQYTATIEDCGLAPEGYAEQVVLVLNAQDEQERAMQLSSAVMEVSYGMGTEVLSLTVDGVEAVPAAEDAQLLYIRLPYNADPAHAETQLVTNGASVRIEGAPEGEEPVFDFSRPVTFTISGGGASTTYTAVVCYSDLPIVYIDTPSEITSKQEWTKACGIQIWNAGPENDAYAEVQVKGRGNTTWSYAKKPYAIKLDKKAAVLGMPKHKRWVLLANFLDITCMRNAVAFETARRLDGLAWTPRGRFVEVVMNGRMLGNYYLCEQIKVDENRVNIAEITPSDIDETAVTGGYIFELDTYFDEAFKFRTSYRNLPVQFKDPDEDIAPEQERYAQDYFNRIEEILYGRNEDGEDVFDYIDMDSFIDWWLVHQLARNSEPVHPKSSYMHKDRGGKLKAGPVWDFDYGTFKPTTSTFVMNGALWYTPLLANPAFVARLKERWAANRERLASIEAYIDETAALIRESAEANHVLWPNSRYDSVNGDTKLTFTEAVERMKESWRMRMENVGRGIEAL